MLVAVPDPEGPNFPKDAAGFTPTPTDLGGRRTVVVSSDDDPYSEPGYVKRLVSSWGALEIKLGSAGHINAESNLGRWDAGWQLVLQLGGMEPLR